MSKVSKKLVDFSLYAILPLRGTNNHDSVAILGDSGLECPLKVLTERETGPRIQNTRRHSSQGCKAWVYTRNVSLGFCSTQKSLDLLGVGDVQTNRYDVGRVSQVVGEEALIHTNPQDLGTSV